MFTLWWVKCPITDLAKLKETWVDANPKLTAKRAKELETMAKNLTPNGIHYVLEDDVANDYTKKVLVAAKKDFQLLLIWPKGTGKTTSIYYLAQETNNPLVPIQLNGATGVDTLIGKRLVNKEGTYRVDGLFTLARKYGFWIVLDELNMALPEITAVLHPALDDRKILVLDEKDWEVIHRHPNTRIFAAINPTEDYAGTKEMNAALVDRFTGEVEVGYAAPRKEIQIVDWHRRVEIDDEPRGSVKEWVITRMVKVANALRRLHKEQKLSFECSTRNVIDWASRCTEMTIKEAAQTAFIAKADSQDKAQINDEIGKLFSEKEKRGKKVTRRGTVAKATEDHYEAL